MDNDVKVIYVSRDADSQLRSWDTVKLMFNAAQSVTVAMALAKAKDQLDLDDAFLGRAHIFVNGVAATQQKVLAHEDMVLLKDALAKDNG